MRIIASSLLVLIAAVPVAAQSRTELQMAAELRILQEEQQRLAIAVAQLSEAMAANQTRTDDRFKSINEMLVKRFADLQLLINNAATDLTNVRERTQDTGTRLGRLADEIEALRSTIAALPGLLQQAASQLSSSPTPVDPANPNAPPAAPPALVLPSVPTAGLSPQKMLEAARNDYFNARYSLAITGFDAVIRTFPTTEAAAEAQYYIGESHAAETKWADAAAAYEQTIRAYPKSPFAPDAYYRRGIALERAGRLPEARKSWEEAVKQFPDSTAAQQSKQSLDRTARQPPR